MEIKIATGKGPSNNQGGSEPPTQSQTTARDLAHLIGVFTLTLPSILPAPVHYRGLQELKHQILKKGGYDDILPLLEEPIEHLNLSLVNGQPLLRECLSLQIETDTS